MGFNVNKLRLNPAGNGQMWKSDKRIYVDKTQEKVVPNDEKGNPGKDAAFLLATPGSEVPMAVAEKLGLVKGSAPAEDKGSAPAENKAAKKSEKKEEKKDKSLAAKVAGK